MESWMVTLIIGGVIGWLASLVMKADGPMGMLANVMVGIPGSYLGIALAKYAGRAREHDAGVMDRCGSRRGAAHLASASARGLFEVGLGS